LRADSEALVFMRRYLDQTVICAFGKHGTVVNVDLNQYVFGKAVKRNPVAFTSNGTLSNDDFVGSGTSSNFIQFFVGPNGYTFLTMQ
ncbi:MAG: hypothetical protein ACKO7C_07595, partial [Bacteroidota bacterium]